MKVGQRVIYKGDMANCSGRGAIFALRSNPSAGQMYSMNFAAGKLEPFDSSISYDIRLEDGREILGMFISSFSGPGGRFQAIEGEAGAEELAALAAGVAAKKIADKAAADAKAEAFAKAKAEALAAGKALGLTPRAEFKGRGSAAAHNLRVELKAAGIKCSVRQDGYSSIDIGVASAADMDAAKKIGNKYEAGSFDGMTDCYEYSPRAWGSVFGDVRYVFERGPSV